jgi:hypothetical protein
VSKRTKEPLEPVSTDLRYPIGECSPPATIGRAELNAWIGQLEALPGNLRDAVWGLSDDQLDTPYRPGGWTVRQVVHHLVDGHLSAYLGFRFALTRQVPAVNPVDGGSWAELIDAKSGPIQPSLALTDGLHRRWVMLMRSLPDDSFKRTFRQADEELSLEALLCYFAWYARHHVAQIFNLRRRKGW